MPEETSPPPAGPPHEVPPPPAPWRRSPVALTLITMLGGLTVGAAVVIWSYSTLWPLGGRSTIEAVSSQAGPTENAFQTGVTAADAAVKRAVIDEWRAVRSDHKAIAYTIAQCFGQDVDQLPRAWFSGLLLDLHPNGDHFWSGAAPPLRPVDASAGHAHTLSDLSSYARTVLFLSDAIGRARIEAASGADSNWPQMIWFSWVLVVVSALGTLFVTLRTSLTDKGGWTVFLTIGAISLSTFGTVLTSAKTFYDPAKAYARNERALLELQKLHQDVMLNFVLSWDPDPGRCNVKEAVAEKEFTLLKTWVGELKDQHEGLVLAAVGDIPLTVQKQVDTIGDAPIERAAAPPAVYSASFPQPAFSQAARPAGNVPADATVPRYGKPAQSYGKPAQKDQPRKQP